MKRCPVCNKSYVDDTLSFCINDGTVLVRDSSSKLESQPTTILSEPPPTVVMRPPLPTDNMPRSTPSSPAPPQPYSWAQDEPQVWRPPPPPSTRSQSQSQTLAVVSLVFGLVSISFGWVCGGPLFALIAVALGLVALMQIRKSPSQYGGKPAAMAGLIIGSFVLLINLALFAVWVVMFVADA